MKSRELRKLVEGFKNPDKAFRETLKSELNTAFAAGQIRPADISFSALFAETFGYDVYNDYRTDPSMSFQDVKETAGALTTASFQNISQQFIAAQVMEAYNIPEAVFSKIIPTVGTDRRFERIAGISHIGDEAQVIDEGKDYPLVGVSEDWVDTPMLRKRGEKMAITKETIMFDTTNVLMERAAAIGEWLGINKEKRAIDCLIDGNTTLHRYNWQNTVYASYVDTPWDNLSASTPLTDYRSFDTLRQLLMAITDPQTGEPQNISIKDVVIPPSLQAAAMFALGGEIRYSPGGYAAAGVVTQSTMPNFITTLFGGQVRVSSSQLLVARETAASIATTTWYIGDINKYAEYREAWPITVAQIGAGSQLDFDRDIVAQWKASEMGAYRVKQPRAMVKATA